MGLDAVKERSIYIVDHWLLSLELHVCTYIYIYIYGSCIHQSTRSKMNLYPNYLHTLMAYDGITQKPPEKNKLHKQMSCAIVRFCQH